ncbi:snRNA-activating protein complex subunit 5 [Stegostoma tigrinum]|uniref:snRNA-activating protein complex subunit 5 n=1 Tax=Stegostoma tigrinum TaxID=3053191 RepID=UPI00202B815D|nr:snRNA-activating protein complex subunit 5 [Stegostoma tigrinum]XP_048419116.1 snRNA-activating protein complex subunit 5 [Stegostoma tigrinum]XP_048419117.1 snRNA-activating protein complex subunit 5 [Stegostoma tigrinum]XP_048419118.1 snRNA-activating protein complex subunit 5 [Stegostoma tigrinum]XP_059495211.1 snRNA-activating protein complex subunit 5 [Stegostoma tigrinum]
MLSRLQELKKEEEALLKAKTTLQDQLNRLKVEELALRSMIMTREDGDDNDNGGQAAEPVESSMQVDDASVINQTQLQLSTLQSVRSALQENEEEEEDEEECIS